jgi:hypothetical protein
VLRTYEHSGIHVVQRPRDKDWIQTTIRQLDRRLFVEMQMVHSGELVWCVMLDCGDAQPPMCLLEWRDDRGDPIPHLSEGIVGEIQRMMRRGPVDVQAIDEANRQLIARREQESSEAYQDIANDFLKIAGRSSTVHRSAQLAATRRKQRRSQPSSPSVREKLRGPEL